MEIDIEATQIAKIATKFTSVNGPYYNVRWLCRQNPRNYTVIFSSGSHWNITKK